LLVRSACSYWPRGLRRQNGAGPAHTAADHPVTGTHWLHEPLILPGSANLTLGFGGRPYVFHEASGDRATVNEAQLLYAPGVEGPPSPQLRNLEETRSPGNRTAGAFSCALVEKWDPDCRHLCRDICRQAPVDIPVPVPVDIPVDIQDCAFARLMPGAGSPAAWRVLSSASRALLGRVSHC